MAFFSQDPLLEEPGVAAHAQDVLIVVAFQHQDIRAPNLFVDGPGHDAGVRDDGDLLSPSQKSEPHRVRRVVRYRERVHLQFAQIEAVARLKELYAFHRQTCAGIRRRSFVGEQAGVRRLEDRRQSFYVIAVAVGEQDGRQPGGFEPYGRQAFPDLFAGDPCVHEDKGVAAADHVTVSAAPACQGAYG